MPMQAPAVSSTDEPGFASWADSLPPPEVVSLLREEHPVYTGKSPPAVVRMRGWLLVVLSRGTLPAEALPFVLEELENSMNPYLTAAAARALRAFPEPRREFLPYIRTALANIAKHDQPVELTVYGGYGEGSATTPIRELGETEKWIGPETAECCGSLPFLGKLTFSPDARRAADQAAKLRFEDHAGQQATYSELFHGQPTIVAFFYTRCDNPLKCSRTVWKIGRVQKLLAERGLAGRIRTAAITYDPEFDTPERLALFGRNRELRMDGQHRLLRALDGIEPLVNHFRLGVSFFRSLVSRHRIEVFVLDARGRVAASFERMDWSEQDAVDVAASLLAEKKAGAGLWSGPVGAILAAVLPKCPMCWAAYASAAGFSAASSTALSGGIRVAAAGLLAVNLASVCWRARSTGRWFGLALSAAGTASAVAQLWFGVEGFAMAGAVLLAIGSMASVSWPGRGGKSDDPLRFDA